MNVLVLYIGEPRLVKSSINNHILFFERLSEYCNVKINLTLQYSTLLMSAEYKEYVEQLCFKKNVNLIFDFITNAERISIADQVKRKLDNTIVLNTEDILKAYFQIISRSLAINKITQYYDRVLIFRTDVLIKNQWADIEQINKAVYTDVDTLYPKSIFNNNQQAILVNDPWWCLGVTCNTSSSPVKYNSTYGIWVDDRIFLSDSNIFKETFGFDLIENITQHLIDKTNSYSSDKEIFNYSALSMSNHCLNLEYLNNLYFKQHLNAQSKLIVFPIQKQFITELITIRDDFNETVFDELDNDTFVKIWNVYSNHPYGQARNLNDTTA